MLDLAAILGFEWDAGNARKSEAKHHVTQAEAEQTFFNEPLVVVADLAHSGSEERFLALGSTDVGRRLLVCFTVRGNDPLIRVISARDMNRKERRRYEQEA